MSVNKKERVPHPPAKAPTACESTDWLDEHRHGNAMTYSSLALIGGNPVAPTSALFRPAKLALRPASLPPNSTAIGSHPCPSSTMTLYDWGVRMQMTRPILASSAVLSAAAAVRCLRTTLSNWINLKRKFGRLISGQELPWIHLVLL